MLRSEDEEVSEETFEQYVARLARAHMPEPKVPHKRVVGMIRSV